MPRKGKVGVKGEEELELKVSEVESQVHWLLKCERVWQLVEDGD